MADVATKITDILKKHMKEPRDDIAMATPLADLKIESLDLAMIVFDIEDSFGIEIPYNANEEASDFKTVGSVVERVKVLTPGSAWVHGVPPTVPRLKLKYPLVGHCPCHRCPQAHRVTSCGRRGGPRHLAEGSGL